MSRLDKTRHVYELLLEFYSRNFLYAGVNEELAYNLINLVWEHTFEADSVQTIKKIFKEAKKQCKNKVVEEDFLNAFHQNFLKVERFLDVGANRLDLLKTLGENYENIENLYAIDTKEKSEITLPNNKSFYFKVDNYSQNLPEELSNIDFINIQFVLHHFPDDSSIIRLLNWCYRILEKDGIVVLWEESFEKKWNKNLNFPVKVFTDENLTEKFYRLNTSEKFAFIQINDWLINFSNSHLQWTSNYKMWYDWVKIFASVGFQLEDYWNLGLRVNGKLKQGVHIIGMFKKK
ncbi:MAG: hypothetical protein KatS3mg085_326 [Candidatus Dojkabacteria bacterium]|nr:MAG: hypothetical protein KatS3mg085_326 [Candidatus Dojkabacteria bacterium]